MENNHVGASSVHDRVVDVLFSVCDITLNSDKAIPLILYKWSASTVTRRRADHLNLQETFIHQ